MVRPLDDTGHALLDAAGRLLADEGASALTVRRIASEAGCSTMGLYSRFGGKDGVVEHLFVEGFEGLIAAMAAVPDDIEPAEEMRALGRAYRSYALQHSTHYLVMFAGAVPGFDPSPDAREVAHASFERLVARVVRGQAAGVLRDDVAADAMAEVIWFTIHGAVMLELVPMAPTGCVPDERYELVLDQITRGWAPDPHPAG